MLDVLDRRSATGMYDHVESLDTVGFDILLPEAHANTGMQNEVVEELREVLHVPEEFTMAIGLVHVMKRIERRSNVPMRKLHDSLDEHFDEIVALGRHHPPTGRVEARGYRNLAFLIVKPRFMTGNPIRTGTVGDVRRDTTLPRATFAGRSSTPTSYEEPF